METITLEQFKIVPTYILVEEEEDIRKGWLQISSKKDLNLFVYKSPEEFVKDLANGIFRATDLFYLDQDFGSRRGVGVTLAKIVRGKYPNACINLVTNYPKIIFRKEIREGLITDVYGKYPAPFENPAWGIFERNFETNNWRSPLEIVS